MLILENLINGLLFGATYSLVAIGFTLIFGVLNRLNIAHGAIVTNPLFGFLICRFPIHLLNLFVHFSR